MLLKVLFRYGIRCPPDKKICSHLPRNKRRIVVIIMPRLTNDQRVWVCLEYAISDKAQKVIGTMRWSLLKPCASYNASYC